MCVDKVCKRADKSVHERWRFGHCRSQVEIQSEVLLQYSKAKADSVRAEKKPIVLDLDGLLQRVP
jgi:hypothetical protein